MEQTVHKLRKAAPYVFLGLCVLVLLFLNVFYLEHWLDSDMAAEMIFSKLLAEQGRWIAPTGWYYSTEFRILYTQLFMAPLFRVLTDWHTIRLLTNLLTYGLLLLSYFYLMKHTGVKKSTCVWAASFLLLPFSETMMLHMHMGNTYMFHVILIFFGLGLFLSVYADLLKKSYGPHFCVRFVLLTGLSLLLGMSGVRYFMSFFAPLLIAVFLLWYRGEHTKKLREITVTENVWETLKASVQDHAIGMSFLLASFISCAALVGYLINGKVIRKLYFFQTYDTTNFVDIYQGDFMNRIQDTLGSLVMLFGYIPGKSVLSLRGLVSICSMVVLILVFRIYGKTCKAVKQDRLAVTRESEEKQMGDSILVTFSGSAFTVSALALIFTTSTNVPRYFIPSMIFLVPVGALYFTKEKRWFDRRVTALLLVLCFGLLTLKTDASMMTTDKNMARKESIAWLMEQGYTFGYATYWNANITQELSNGALVVANILEPESMGFFEWSSEEAYYLDPGEAGSKVPAGKVFLLLTNKQVETYGQAPALTGGEMVYVDDEFVIFSYENAEDLLQYRIR